MYRSHVLVCGGTGCTSSGSVKIIEEFERELAATGLTEEVKVVKTGYEAQVKRFNVRQAIDQQEISSFFMLVPKE